MRARLFRIFIGLIGVIGLAAVGLTVFAFAEGLSFRDIKRNVRIVFDLPKFWETDFNQAVSLNTELPCPGDDALVIVTGGQSNAANNYGPAPPPDANPRTFMFFGGKCFKLRSPVLGATNPDDSLWPTLGLKLNAATKRPIVFINGAVGGTQIGDWVDERSHYLSRLIDQVLAARKTGLNPAFVLWIQGETDSGTKTPPATYVEQQRAIIEKMAAAGATDAQTPWVVFFSTRCLHRPNNGPEIEKALTEESLRPGSRVIIGPNVTAFDDDFRHDTCHLNERGRDRLAAETLDVLTSKGLIRQR